MYRVVLVFGDTEDLSNFLMSEQMKGIETNSFELTLSGELSATQINTACKKYGAYIRVFRQIRPDAD